MNKQEALVALLEEVRRYEAPHEEVRLAYDQTIQGVLLDAARELDMLIGKLNAGDVTARTLAQYRQRLRKLGGAVLALMVTEVDIVSGRSLEEWLAEGRKVGTVVDAGVVVQVTGSPASPVAINGSMMREAYAKGVHDGRRGA